MTRSFGNKSDECVHITVPSIKETGCRATDTCETHDKMEGTRSRAKQDA